MPFVFTEPESPQQFWAHNAVKGKKNFQPTNRGDDGAALAAATGRWLQPGEDYPIKQAAEANMGGMLPDTQAGRDAGVLMRAVHDASPVSTTLYRGLQVPEIPKKGDIIREPLGSWTSTAATAEGYAHDPAGAAVFGKAVPGKEVVLEVARAKAVALPMEEFVSGGIFTVTGRRVEDGMTYVALQQNRTYEPPQGFSEAFAEPPNAGQPEWKTVQRIAGSEELPLAKAIEAAFAAAGAGIDEEKMALELAVHGNTSEIDWAELSKQLSDVLEASIRRVTTGTALELLPRFASEQQEGFVARGFTERFDDDGLEPIPGEDFWPKAIASMNLVLSHSAAESYLRKHLPTLVTQVTWETQEAIRDVILDGFQNGIPPRDMARTIRKMVGITRPQGRTLDRLIKHWVEVKLPRNNLDNNVRRQVDKMIRYRALNIARTETLRAANAGQQALWQAATNEGLLQRDVTRREWIATPSERTCKYCMALDGVQVGMNDSWHSLLGDVMEPPLHPSCRCAMGIAISTEPIPEAPRKDYVKDFDELYEAARKGKDQLQAQPNGDGPLSPGGGLDADLSAWGRSWMPAPNPNQERSIKAYSGNSYDSINSGLRFARDKYLPGSRFEIDDIESAMQPISEDMIVRRGTSGSAFSGVPGVVPLYPSDTTGSRKIQDLAPAVGQTITDWGFLSTTTRESGFDGHVNLKILAPKGTRAFHMNAYDTSEFPSEEELLFARGTKLRIIRVERHDVVRLGMNAINWDVWAVAEN